MGQSPETVIISEEVFKRPECPKNFEKYVKNAWLSNEITIQGKKFYVISWCEHYDSNMWAELEQATDKNGDVTEETKELKEYTSKLSDDEEEDDEYEYDWDFKFRVENWLEKLMELDQELVF